MKDVKNLKDMKKNLVVLHGLHVSFMPFMFACIAPTSS